MADTRITKNRVALALIAAALIASAVSCSFLLGPEPTESKIEYYSKTVEYSRYVDPAQNYYVPVERRMYDRYGRLSGIYRHTYEPVAGDTDYWVLKRTDLYEVSTTGVEGLAEYYVYSYVADDYTAFDDDDVAYAVHDYKLTRGDSYTPAGYNWHYYAVAYQDLPNQPDRYTSIVDYARDSGGAFGVIARQESTYRLIYEDPVLDYDYYDYVTEKFFLSSTPGGTLKLSEEFASWYNATAQWTHEIYHTFRGDDAANEVWYYTKYDWNEAGQVFAQQDFYYDPSDITTIATYGVQTISPAWINPAGAMPSLTFANIGALAESLTKSYDELGNVSLKVRSALGAEYERIVYRYEGDKETSMLRYVNGKHYAYDRTETRYYDIDRDGVAYGVAEELVYHSGETGEADEESASMHARWNRALSGTGRGSARSAISSIINNPIVRPLRSNHDR